MRFMKTIRFKPKPEFLDDFLIEYHKITEAALKDGLIDSYLTQSLKMRLCTLVPLMTKSRYQILFNADWTG